MIDFWINAIRQRNLEALGVESFRMHRLRRKPRWTAGVVKMRDGELHYVDGASAQSAWHAIYQEHLYDFPTASQSPVIIDCGANIGLAVRYWLSRFNSPVITAIEPDPAIFAVLEQNCGMRQGVKLLQAAVAETAGTATFRSSGDDAGHLNLERKDAIGPNEVTVETIRLSELIREIDRPIDFLKIDIEGAETLVLKEASHELGRVQNLFVEYHGYEHSLPTLHDLLTTISDCGFRYHLVPELWSRSPFRQIQPDAGMDQRINLCATRVRK
ncbi:FkbM family methyltransferase [Rhodopirellula sp. MGV]|uniref:FkbM family methyltransferase n=1 Tax=Rhodopirellula sp. MGV TaxID=2023130 RepID=UPI000B968ABB|nr:FkbM family methyltransferase [Rhodopirellula sp. MGV]OYP37477.1 hypothetical protein CGZ80_04935 [Rhodopirellula sp. MGV]PNY37879.1 FkbM family methyltransferase [Rhodopirellula baltica]